MISPIPIVLIHTGNSWYLPYTIWQLRKTNKDTDIYLIGNKGTKHFGKIINHIDIKEFEDADKQLKKVYKHKSNLGKDFEYTCIQRWFILHDFMKENNLKSSIYLDSDILV